MRSSSQTLTCGLPFGVYARPFGVHLAEANAWRLSTRWIGPRGVSVD